MSFDPSIFRAYDMRGIYPSQMNEEVAYAAGQAFVQVMQAKKVAIGRDVRATGMSLQQAMIKGITDAGADVLEIGVISTEMLYFAAATLECDGGLSITASHNPAEWNGVKCIGPGAVPLTREDRLGEMYEFIKSERKLTSEHPGNVEQVELLPRYTEFLKKFVPADIAGLKIVANPNFGADGKIVDAVVAELPLEIIRLNWQEDGTFPKGTPDPMLPKNRDELSALIISEHANFGVAWDADADRCFFFDEKGRFFHGYYLTALLINYFLKLRPGASVVTERRLVWANQETIAENGGVNVPSLTGHGYMKQSMRRTNAVFGGEISGHYYFGDFFYCDNGMVSFLTVMGIFAQEITAGRSVSALLDTYLERYPILLQEQNYTTPRAAEIIALATQKYATGKQDAADGISVEFPEWRFNLRMSANEPIMRMNMEARSAQELEIRHTELHSLITAEGAVLRDDNH